MPGDLQHLVMTSIAFTFGAIDRRRCQLGYGPCLELTGPDFQSVFNLNLWAANAKLISYYMGYGCVPHIQHYTPRLTVYSVVHRGVLFLSMAYTVSQLPLRSHSRDLSTGH